MEKATVHDWLLFSCGFSCLLLLARVVATGSPTYLFLPWNLFLAFIPYWITAKMIKEISLIEVKWKLYALLTVWLLFIPNSFYIITDLFHLTHIESAPKWFDLLMLFSFAWNGLLPGVISLRRVELIITIHGWERFDIPFVFAVMWLSAFGIYIGRYLRFNSWDVITNPFSLAAEIMDMVLHPFQHAAAWGMTLVYGVFMTLLYFTFKKIGETIYLSKGV